MTGAEILALAATQRELIRTIMCAIHLWIDRSQVALAWQRWAMARPPGSVSVLSSAATLPAPLVGTPPTERLPLQLVSSVWFARPNRWRVETTAVGGDETGIQVIDGNAGEFAVARLDRDGSTRLGSSEASLLGAHAAVEGMLRPESLFDEVQADPAGRSAVRGRDCYRLLGSPQENGGFPVWPAEAYEFLLDVEWGLLLGFRAHTAGHVIASADLSDLLVDEPISAETFRLSPPIGMRTRNLHGGTVHE